MPTPRELRKIFAAARELGLEEEKLRDLVEQVSGQRSTRALDALQTSTVIDALVRLGAASGAVATKPSGRRSVRGVTKLITPGQHDMIAVLRTRLGGDWLRDEYFEGACGRLLRKDRPRTAGEAARTIEMLRARLAHRERRSSPAGRA